MRAVDVIVKKREGKALTREEIRFFIEGFTQGEIPDYQAAAWAMAVLLNGMTPQETAELTLAMVDSGDRLDLSSIVDHSVDKHSTGGVGDKTTLVVIPAVAAGGASVGKMSGRGLGFSGGTLDKMESVPGFRVDLTRTEFLEQLKRIGLVLSGQTTDLAPADGKLYALRDVTGTVPSMPLIASSVMSKKIATGAQAVVLDVKVGSGAFTRDIEQAKELARLMVDIGDRAGRRVVALISDMNQPLGEAVGNALEVKEAIDTLKGEGPDDFQEHCVVVGANMLLTAGLTSNIQEGKDQITQCLKDGSALDKFKDLVSAQGGSPIVIEDPAQLPGAECVQVVEAPEGGFVSQIDAEEVGLAAVDLGAGREKKGEPIDHGVGFLIHKRVGDPISKGEPLFTVHAKDEGTCQSAKERVLGAHRFSMESVKPIPLFYETIRGEGG